MQELFYVTKPISATTKKQHIEKLSVKFNEIQGGCTANHTKTIQSIRNPDELAIYVYLSSKPPEWNVNVKELMDHFGIGRDRVYKALKNLQMRRLILRKEIREKGKFIEFEYYLFLSPFPENKEVDEPFPDLPEAAKPEAVNQEAYKEEKLPYKEKNIKKVAHANSTPKTSKHPKPTQFDLQEYAHGVKGYEWVGEYRKDMGLE